MNNPFYTFPDQPEEPALLPQNAIDPTEVRRHFSKVGLAYLIMTVAFMAAAYVVQFAVLLCFPVLLHEWWFSWAISLIPLYGVGLPVLLLCLRRVPVSPHNPDYTAQGVTSEKSPFRFGHWMILLVIAFSCMTAGSIVGNIVMGILSVVMDYDYAFVLNSMVSDAPAWFTFVCTCICAPLGEELLFRKLLIDRTRRFGDLTAILLSGLLFGLFHGNLFQFFYAALVGMILAYVYTRWGKYHWCVIMHAVINFMGSIVSPALAEYAPTDLVDFANPVKLAVYLFLLLWQYGGLIAGITLFCVFFSRRKLSRGVTNSDKAAGFFKALVNPGMLACVVIMLVLLVVNLIPAR